MATGTGIDGQLAFGQETTYGTNVTPDRFFEFNSESLVSEPSWLEPVPIRSGTKYKRINNILQSRQQVSGEVELNHTNKGMGVLWKNALGSTATATQIGTTTAYEQIHTPGGLLGTSLTAQVGKPEPSTGTVHPFNYTGLKVTSWEFSLVDNETPTLNLTFDGRESMTDKTLAAVSYPTGLAIFSFANATLQIGGTASTSSGVTSVSGATAISTRVGEVTISGENPMAVERYGVGNNGLKNEPLTNETPTVTGTLEADFNKTELYDVFANNTTTTLQVAMTGGVIGTSGESFAVEFILPAVKIKSAQPTVEGKEVVSMSTEIEAYDDDTNPVIQVRIVSDEQSV